MSWLGLTVPCQFSFWSLKLRSSVSRCVPRDVVGHKEYEGHNTLTGLESSCFASRGEQSAREAEHMSTVEDV